MGKYFSIPGEAAERINAKRRRTLVCDWCGQRFETSAPRVKFCSAQCKARRQLQRLAAQHNYRLVEDRP